MSKSHTKSCICIVNTLINEKIPFISSLSLVINFATGLSHISSCLYSTFEPSYPTALKGAWGVGVGGFPGCISETIP